MDNLTYIDEIHCYLNDKGMPVPSVTQIIKAVLPDSYAGVSKEVLEKAAKRGSRVHTATELIDVDLQPDLDDEITPYVLAYKSLGKIEWDKSEYFVYSENVNPYCGRGDRELNGEPYDIKTYSTITKDMLDKIALQLTAYDVELKAKKGWVLHLQKNGKAKKIDVDLIHNDWLNVLIVFYRWHYPIWLREMKSKLRDFQMGDIF